MLSFSHALPARDAPTHDTRHPPQSWSKWCSLLRSTIGWPTAEPRTLKKPSDSGLDPQTNIWDNIYIYIWLWYIYIYRDRDHIDVMRPSARPKQGRPPKSKRIRSNVIPWNMMRHFAYGLCRSHKNVTWCCVFAYHHMRPVPQPQQNLTHLDTHKH